MHKPQVERSLTLGFDFGYQPAVAWKSPSNQVNTAGGPVTTLFGKIIRREIPADVVYEDDFCLAFRDINPQAPTHVLLIPKKEIDRLANAGSEDQALLGHLMLAAGKVAKQLGVGDAFRLVVNNGAQAGQSVFHLHLHILAGRKLEWPPG
jgi:histidine triad (HIT) family protein